MCIADEIASAAELVMGKDRGVPVAIVRGMDRAWVRSSSVPTRSSGRRLKISSMVDGVVGPTWVAEAAAARGPNARRRLRSRIREA